MTCTIVSKDGTIKRFISVDYCDFGYDYDSIIIYCDKYKKQDVIYKKDSASVVFYP